MAHDSAPPCCNRICQDLLLIQQCHPNPRPAVTSDNITPTNLFMPCPIQTDPDHPSLPTVYDSPPPLPSPITTSFFILHVNRWAPGTLDDYHSNTYILAGMYDLTGFIIQASINITSHNLAQVFFQEFLLKFGMCSLFEAMCKSIYLHLYPTAKANHKAVSVELPAKIH